MNLNLNLIPYSETNSIGKRLTRETQNYKTFRQQTTNIGENLHYLGLDKELLDLTPNK